MTNRIKLWASIAAVSLSLGVAPQAQAAGSTATGSLLVTAVVLSVCTVASTPVVFANYTLLQTDVQGSLIVTCTPDVTTYKIGLGAGNGTSSTVTSRKMKSLLTATELAYGLYRDSQRTLNWGETQSVDTLDVTGAGAISTYPVYGRLPANQNGIAPGAYLDTIQVSVFY